MLDFNKIVESGKKLDIFEESRQKIEAGIDFDLTGKSGADYSKSEYSEIPITNTVNAGNLDVGLDYGDLLCVTELKPNELFDKLVFLKDYSTQTNKFDKFKSDLIFDFIDRDGLEVRSRAFGKLDTSNRITLIEKLKTLKGSVVWLQGRLNKRSSRMFIDVIHIQESNVDQPVAKEFFKREIANKREICNEVWKEIAKYPLSNAIYSAHELLMTTTSIKDVYERQGGYIYYLHYLLNTLAISPLEIEIKDKVVAYDIIQQLKMHVNNIELSKKVQHFAISKYDNETSEEILNDTLFKNDSEKSVYLEILEGLRKGIITMLLLEDWSRWGIETVYSNYHKNILRIGRGK